MYIHKVTDTKMGDQYLCVSVFEIDPPLSDHNESSCIFIHIKFDVIIFLIRFNLVYNLLFTVANISLNIELDLFQD